MLHRSSLLLALSFIVVSCNNGVSPTILNGGPSVYWSIPHVGTTYIFQVLRWDTVTKELDTLRIINTHQIIGSKLNAARAEVRYGGSTPDTFVFAYEPNGDFSIGTQYIHDSMLWTTYPTTSGRIIADPALDTIEGSQHIIETRERSSLGTENLVLAGQSLPSIHVQGKYRVVSSPDSSIGTTDFWLSPSLGFYIQYHYTEFYPTGETNNTCLKLIHYSPK